MEPKLPLKGKAVTKLTGPESQDMTLPSIHRLFHLGEDIGEIIMNLDMRRVQVAPQDTVRTGEYAAFDEIDRPVTAADVMPCSRAVPDNVPFSFCTYRL